VGKRLARHTESEYKDTKWEFTTLDSDVINAFALPGGKVFMSRGLLEQLNSEAALAGVLGHEIGHVTGRHIDERISHAMVAQGLGSVASAAAGGAGGWAEVIPLVVGVGGQGYLLKFGRDQESQADELGLKYMVKTGYDPQGMADVMRVLIKASEGSSQWEMLSTHPDPQRRLADILARIDNEYAYTKGDPKYKKFENRFERGAAPYLPKRSAAAGTATGVVASPVLWCAHCRAASEGFVEVTQAPSLR
jgi:predicted Zn-dependent protease